MRLKGLKEEELFKELCKAAQSKGYLSKVDYEVFLDAFGERFKRAWETLKARRVKKYVFSPSGKVLWVVVGKKREYLILPMAGFCSCNDFFYRVMNGKSFLCYHLIAQRLAETLNIYDTVEETDAFYDLFMKEWKKVTP